MNSKIKEIKIMNNQTKGETEIMNNKSKGELNIMNNLTKVVTSKIILQYAHIFSPFAYDKQFPARYSAKVIIPKTETETIANINAAIEMAKQIGYQIYGDKISKDTGLKSPLFDGDRETVTDKMLKGSYYMTASNKSRPGVVDQDLKPELSNYVIDGTYARVSVNFKPYFFKDSNEKVHRGISCELLNVQLFSERFDVSTLLSTPEEDFA